MFLPNSYDLHGFYTWSFFLPATDKHLSERQRIPNRKQPLPLDNLYAEYREFKVEFSYVVRLITGATRDISAGIGMGRNTYADTLRSKHDLTSRREFNTVA